ncbi:MAG: NAD-dependent epimerase/dehydratase family protein, partial [Alistipes sp.]
YLRKIYGNANVVATDVRECPMLAENGPFEVLNALDAAALDELVRRHKIDAIFNLVALLSAVGEKDPQLAWKINIGALMNSLEIARQNKCAIFTPSSIGAFGGTSPKDKTPQDTIMRPTTMYGVCKVTGELMGDYYYTRYGVDARSVRFPGLISNVTMPGGGTTDYAVEIYYEAVRSGRFTCPLPSDIYMDMMYMPDALRACVELMEADPAKLIHRNSFNIASMSFTPEIICAELQKRMPDFKMDYNVDPVKQAIAESWPNSLDDTCARAEWGWKPEWNLSTMTDDMLAVIRAKNLK